MNARTDHLLDDAVLPEAEAEMREAFLWYFE